MISPLIHPPNNRRIILSKRPFCWSSLVTSRAFWFSTAALCVVTLVMASLPLTSVLGFEYCLFFGVIATIVMSHFALVAMYMRNDATQGPSLFGTITQVILACWTMLLPPLALISLNAFRVTNCNFTYGLFLYGLTAGVGAIRWDTTKPDGTPKKQLDMSRLHAMGWTAQIPLVEGLGLAYQDFKSALVDQRLRG